MGRRGNRESFWPSYVDIMTTLFAIMVILFVVSFSRFRNVEKELQKFAGKYREIEAIYDAVAKIDPNYFEFNKEYVKHIFKIQVTFQTGCFNISDQLQADLDNPALADSLRREIIRAGHEIERTISGLQKTHANQDIKYLVVIEGQASKDGYGRGNDYFNNDVLSYQRALNLRRFWQEHGIDFTSMSKCELVVSGSGEGGIPRVSGDESLNQRFLIHIVPVIGNIKLKDRSR